ncbi:soluble NSF attachment family protein [Candidatus Sulfidibacterium hydrothermale]|uniref:tetratricopeptide repeat protein n=1 Tax=Candidatus Sulfidibacterium hydrothermale TaxID=2875962 RepID=UPI001F0A9262|nr:tetratricopeptide repeat protein [Candidatus Sulfidibacterium hydrothermale]UBM61503.1 soluble NSF attachment family protein [Candidatus Sulfidibacterium hydrothermale]
MSKKKHQEEKTQHQFENIEQSLSKTEEFIIENQKVLTIIVAVIVLIVLGFFGVKKYYLQPKEKEAQEQIYMAQHYFQADSLDKALYGDGNNLGFVDIAKMYSITKAGNLADYYAGICFLKKGNFDNAIKYLKKFDSDDEIVGPMAKGALGDAYLEKGDKEKAVKYYMEAANLRDNEFTSPLFLLKAGEVDEMLGNYDKAIEAYKRIQQDYYKSLEARDIEKYIARAQELKKQK